MKKPGWTNLLAAVTVLVGVAACVARDEPPARSADGVFAFMDTLPPADAPGRPWVRPREGRGLIVDFAALRAAWAAAPLARDAEAPPLVIELPDPSGGFQAFTLIDSPVVVPALAAALPSVRTFAGVGLDDRQATLRASLTPLGLQVQVLTPAGSWYIDPVTMGDTRVYAVYTRAGLDQPRWPWGCEVPAEVGPIKQEQADALGGLARQTESGTAQLRTFRAAISATGEFTQFYGGTVPLAQAGIVAIINRVNGIYERDLGVRLTLIDNTPIVFTDPATDGFTNGAPSTLIDENEALLETVIGEENYDVGHNFGTGGGGVATLRSVCTPGVKARAATGLPNPVGDVFAVDYVSHELGHQFGARHTFNSVLGSCGGNRSAPTAYEPGSGSTIMGYTGICGLDNLQTNSDAMFHHVSLADMQNHLASIIGCGSTTPSGNNPPVVSATVPPAPVQGGIPISIPKGTPFTLTALASDPNGNALSYSWEQDDPGGDSGSTLASADDGVMPLFRTYAPSASRARTFPRWSVILDHDNIDPTNVEKLPDLPRVMDFTVVVRDNQSPGGVTTANLPINVAASAGPFKITFPNTETLWGPNNVIWDVAATNLPPVNCASVDILLSLDGGATFPYVMASDVPNTGLYEVDFTGYSGENARLMVRAHYNVFFDVSGPNRVTALPSGVDLRRTNNLTFSDAVGDTVSNNGNGIIEPGENAIQLFIEVRNQGQATATTVRGTLSSVTPGVTVTRAQVTYPALASGDAAVNNTNDPYIISVDPSLPCGAPINLQLIISSSQGNALTTVVLSTGSLPGALGPQVGFSWPNAQSIPASAPVEIPNNNANGVTIQFPVSGIGEIGEVQFRFDGSACSPALNAQTVGLTHSYVGDLVITLISPSGTEVKLMNRPGDPPGGSSGNNFCNTLLADTASTSIQAIKFNTAPYVGSFTPAQPLATLIGQSGDGVWKLRIQDLDITDLGRVRAFTLLLRGRGSTVCAAPVGALCAIDYNRDRFINLDDLSDFINDFYVDQPVPGGLQPDAPTYPEREVGFGVPCPLAPNALGPYAPGAYRDHGYRVGFSFDGTTSCPQFVGQPFPNLDSLADYITAYYSGGC